MSHTHLCLPSAEYKVLHPVDKDIKADCATYLQPSSLMRQPLSTRRSAPGVTIRSKGARISSHKDAKKVAARSPGPIYNLPSTLKLKQRASFGVGERFPVKKVTREDGPGPAGITLGSTLGKNSRSSTLKGRKSWRVRAVVETRKDSPGPAADTFTVPSTVGRDSRKYSMIGRDPWLDSGSKLRSPTSTLRALKTQWRTDSEVRSAHASPLARAASHSLPVSPVRVRR